MVENNSIMDQLGLDDYVEPQVFDDGSTVRLKVYDSTIEEGVSDKGPWSAWQLVCQATGYESEYPEITNPKMIYHRIWFPKADAKPAAFNITKGKIIKAYDAIGEYPVAGKLNREDFIGKEFDAVLGVDSSGEEPKNTIKRFLKAV